jgi:glycosyltransferase involved in cell wall biosynthesis
MALPVAFYAPLKSPNHPSPSGDRTMARLLIKALGMASFAPHLASELRTLDITGDPETQERLRSESLAAADVLVEHYRSRPEEERPRLWFTYHVYYKAPDWIGPLMADALAIPYVVAEGSRAGKREFGRWRVGHRGAEAALDRADIVFVMTPDDREALERSRSKAQSLIELPPFLDETAWLGKRALARTEGGPPRLLTVAMMRDGDKRASYELLAAALSQLADIPWTLDVVGDGPARGRIEPLFDGIKDRVRFHGEVQDACTLRSLYAQSHLLVWPAVNEAYGMALLEAQALGCPVVAGAFGGVGSVVRDGMTGLLSAPGDLDGFVAAVRTTLQDRALLQRLGHAAWRFVSEERGLSHAASRLHAALMPLAERGAP